MIYVVSYLGLAAGALITKFTKEEIKSGKGYFKILRAMVAAVIWYAFLDYVGVSAMISVATSIMMLGIQMVMRHDFINYAVFAVMSYIARDPSIFTFIFIYGLAAAALWAYEGKHVVKLLLANSVYLIIYFISGRLAWL